MNKTEKNDFLRGGGKLLRRAHNKQGKPVIKEKNKTKDWHEAHVFDSLAIRDATFDGLVKYQSAHYKADED